MSLLPGNLPPNKQRFTTGNGSNTGVLPIPASNTTQTPGSKDISQVPGLQGILSNIGNVNPAAPKSLSANPLFNSGNTTNNLTTNNLFGSSQSGIFSLNGLSPNNPSTPLTPGGQDPLKLGQFSTLFNPGVSQTNGQATPANDPNLLIQRQKQTNDTIKALILSVLKQRKEKAQAEETRRAEQKRKDDAARQKALEDAEAKASQAKLDAEKAKSDADAAKNRADSEARSKNEAEARAKAEGEARARAEGEAKARAEGEAKARAEGEARARAEGEERARREAEERNKPAPTSFELPATIQSIPAQPVPAPDGPKDEPKPDNKPINAVSAMSKASASAPDLP